MNNTAQNIWPQAFTRPAARELKAPLLMDASILVLTIILVSFSLVMVYSTTGVVAHEKYGDPLFFVKRQSAAVLLGFLGMYLCSRVRIGFLKKMAVYCLPLALLLMVLPLVSGVGDSVGGAKRWIKFGSVGFQPGEFVKLIFVIFLCGYFARHEDALEQFTTGLLKPFLFVALVAGLFLLQPDLGSCVILAIVTLGMAAAAGVCLRHVIFCFAGCGLAMALLIMVSPYRMNRIAAFLSPFSDMQGKGYQLVQSLIAVGSGKLWGVGLGSSQQKLFFLPAAHTDFIYAVIAEELGFVGALAVLLVFLLFLWRGLKLAGRFVNDTFSFCLGVGLTLLIAAPALVNMGVVLGLLPTKGLVLPLLAYGGSSLVASLMGVGLMLALARSFYEE
ncbi:MAG: putative lipid II flippase FtsW [Deltaproteobacteria bacterium]|nr:putative lipid II flippase FtsW [Deltaproteobacteria bacterium]